MLGLTVFLGVVGLAAAVGGLNMVLRPATEDYHLFAGRPRLCIGAVFTAAGLGLTWLAWFFASTPLI